MGDNNLTTLISNLQSIYTEVTNKIIPENIKAGVTIFGVTGTYSGEDTNSNDTTGEEE